MHSALQRLPIFLVFLVFSASPKTYMIWILATISCHPPHWSLSSYPIEFLVISWLHQGCSPWGHCTAASSAWNTLHQIFRYFSLSLHVGLIWKVLHLKVISLETPSLITLSKRSSLPLKILQSLFKPLSRMWATWDQGQGWFFSL